MKELGFLPLFFIYILGLFLASNAQSIPPPTGQVPVDWAPRVKLGYMLYNATEPAREDLKPQVGNGYLSTLIGGDSVYVSGVFNPLLPNQPASRSRRSRFPTPVRLSVDGAAPFATALDVRRGIFYRRSYMKLGADGKLFVSGKGIATCLALFEQRWYAHRVNRSLLMHELEVDVSRCSSTGSGSGILANSQDGEAGNLVFSLVSNDGGASQDINITQVGSKNSNPALYAGPTILPEKPGGILIGTALASTPLSNVISVAPGSIRTFYYINAYLTSLDYMPYPLPRRQLAPSLVNMDDFPSVQKREPGPMCYNSNSDIYRVDCGTELLDPSDCRTFGCCYDGSLVDEPKCYFGLNLTGLVYDLYWAAFQQREILMKSHIQEWENMWQASIEVEGDTDLRNVVYASYYAVLSAIRNDWSYSISPGGLSTGGGNATGYPRQEREGYFGHTFWDADTWVMPSLLPLYPELAQSIIKYRFDRIPASRIVANNYGYKGTKFAWESALTGLEECGFPNDEDHLSADIAISVRQYFRATGDMNWLRTVGFPLLTGIADFWVSRVEKDVSGLYVVDFVQPPNEYADHVNNSVFTNAAASLALEFTVRAAELLGVKVPDVYMEVSKKMKIPFDPSIQQYIEYDGRSPSDMTPIKQADVTLMGYPLQWPMSNEIKRNDLIHETEVMDPYGPAMTHGIFCIAWLDLGTKDEETLKNASVAFQNGYGLYVKPPYNTWIECPDPGCVNQAIFNGEYSPPCPNFITGAGGFLQSLLYGYLGLRYNEGNMTMDPVLPMNTTSILVHQLFYLNSKMDVGYDGATLTITPRDMGTPALVVVGGDGKDIYPLQVGQPVSLPVGPVTVMPRASSGLTDDE